MDQHPVLGRLVGKDINIYTRTVVLWAVGVMINVELLAHEVFFFLPLETPCLRAADSGVEPAGGSSGPVHPNAVQLRPPEGNPAEAAAQATLPQRVVPGHTVPRVHAEPEDLRPPVPSLEPRVDRTRGPIHHPGNGMPGYERPRWHPAAPAVDLPQPGFFVRPRGGRRPRVGSGGVPALSAPRLRGGRRPGECALQAGLVRESETPEGHPEREPSVVRGLLRTTRQRRQREREVRRLRAPAQRRCRLLRPQPAAAPLRSAAIRGGVSGAPRGCW